MAHSRRSFALSPGQSRVKRKVTWDGGPEGISSTLTDNSVSIFATGAEALSDITVVRIRGHVELMVGGSADLSGWDAVALGICIVSQNAFGVGVTAVPNPLTDIGWDGWQWHWIAPLHVSDLSLEGTPFRTLVEIDNKSMRKMRSTDTIIGVVATGIEVGTATLTSTMQTRILSKVT